MRQALTTLVFLLPPSALKIRLLNRLGHRIHPKAQLGICLVRHVERFDLAEGVLIGHFNFFHNMALVQMGRGSRIFFFNQILGGSGFEPGAEPTPLQRTLQMGAHSHIISQHYVDCGAGVTMADECWITGMRSTVLTHSFDPHNGGIVLEPITLERGAIVATCCTLLPGTVVGEGALLAAGSTTWTGQQVKASSLSGGVPARRLSEIIIPAKAYLRARYPD